MIKKYFSSIRCQQIVEKAFSLWNEGKYSRRLHRVQLLTDISHNYQPMKQVRSVTKRNLSIMNLKEISKKTKTSKSITIKCANHCDTDISPDEPFEQDAIECQHQSARFSWIDSKLNCSRWLCYDCQIKLKIKTDSIWICSEHIHIHVDTDEDENETEY